MSAFLATAEFLTSLLWNCVFTRLSVGRFPASDSSQWHLGVTAVSADRGVAVGRLVGTAEVGRGLVCVPG